MTWNLSPWPVNALASVSVVGAVWKARPASSTTMTPKKPCRRFVLRRRRLCHAHLLLRNERPNEDFAGPDELLYKADYDFRDVYLLTAAEDTAPDTPEHAIGGLKGWLKVFNQASLKGTVFAGGTMEDGTIAGHPELEEAEAMGRKV